ncbi:MAG: sulfatase-like hydrolase/transferase [Spirosomataceae bacterium]
MGHHAAVSPHPNALSKQTQNTGIQFYQKVCASPVCTPSRAAFFSGLYPHKTGAYYNGGNHWQAPSVLTTIESLPECFKRNGYETFGRGKIFHADIGKEREEAMFDNRPIYQGGFGPFGEQATWVGPGQFQSVKAWEGPDSDFPDVKNADAAIEFLQKSHDKPFFCYVGYWRPHTPYTAPKRFLSCSMRRRLLCPQATKRVIWTTCQYKGVS